MYLSEYCDVDYNETYNVVFVKWKKFCCKDDYRKPLEYALEIIKKYCNSIKIIKMSDEESEILRNKTYIIKLIRQLRIYKSILSIPVTPIPRTFTLYTSSPIHIITPGTRNLYTIFPSALKIRLIR